MKHDTKTGWCICGERHTTKKPDKELVAQLPPAPEPEPEAATLMEEGHEEALPGIPFVCPTPRL